MQVAFSSAVENGVVPDRPLYVTSIVPCRSRGTQNPANPLSNVVVDSVTITSPVASSTMRTSMSCPDSSPRQVVRLWKKHSWVCSMYGAIDKYVTSSGMSRTTSWTLSVRTSASGRTDAIKSDGRSLTFIRSRLSMISGADMSARPYSASRSAPAESWFVSGAEQPTSTRARIAAAAVARTVGRFIS